MFLRPLARFGLRQSVGDHRGRNEVRDTDRGFAGAHEEERLIDEAPVALAVLDADRDSLLYANDAARQIGITSLDEMARLVLDEDFPLRRVTTLADLVVGAPFQPSPMRLYRAISSRTDEYRIGFAPRKADSAAPVVGVYGDWTPLTQRGELFEEDLDRSDPWQFKNVLV